MTNQPTPKKRPPHGATLGPRRRKKKGGKAETICTPGSRKHRQFKRWLDRKFLGTKPSSKPPNFFAGIAEGLTNHKMTQETPEEE